MSEPEKAGEGFYVGEEVGPMQGTRAWAGGRRYPYKGMATAAQPGRLELKRGEGGIYAAERGIEM